MLSDPHRAARRTESPAALPPLPKEELPAEARSAEHAFLLHLSLAAN